MAAPEGNKNAQKDDLPRNDQLLVVLNEEDKKRWKKATEALNATTNVKQSRNDIILKTMNEVFADIQKKADKALEKIASENVSRKKEWLKTSESAKKKRAAKKTPATAK